jgi:microfibrillar-associated protein 1
MTANPTRPARYRPGKAAAEDPSSSEEEDEEEEETSQAEDHAPSQLQTSSFPSEATKVTRNLKKVDLNARRQQAAAAEEARVEAEKAAREKEEEGFVTEESEEADSEESGEEDSSEEEESSEDEAPRVLVRPTFIKRERRNGPPPEDTQAEEDRLREEEERRKAAADEIVQEQLRKDAEAREARKKNWDDDEGENLEDIDDTDGLDPEMEKAAWKVRELKRIKRDREAIEKAEQEREEIERRRNLSKEDREAEDADFLARQKEESENKGQMSYLQKYYHKGAFFQDDAKEVGLDRRDIMGSRFQDEVTNRELLPKYMQIRDMTKLGKKSASKYRDLKSEDTGKWGEFGDRRGARESLDERFMSDRDREKMGASGANTTAVGTRKRVGGAPEGAPEGPKALRGDLAQKVDMSLPTDTYRPGESHHEQREGHGGFEKNDPRRRSPRQRSRSPSYRHDDRRRHKSPRYRSRSWSGDKRHRSRSGSGDRRHRDQYRDHRERRKRSPSPFDDKYDNEKRRRVDVR